METIAFECPCCGRVSRVALSFAGRQGRCPGCREVIFVPDPSRPEDAQAAVEPAAAPDVIATVDGAGGPGTADEAAPATLPPALGTGEAPAPPAPTAPSAPTAPTYRPCPRCGEPIRTAARKCRHCGQFLDEGVAAARRARARGPRYTLASPATRLAACLIDEVALRVPAFALYIACIPLLDGREEELAAAAAIVATIYLLALMGYQWFLTATRGQTLAKRWLSIKIVRVDGSPVDFVSGVIIRNWVTMLLAQVVPFFPLVDACLIFAADHRCVHDHLAGTRVIQVTARRPPAAAPP